jgi:hypothetical protein
MALFNHTSREITAKIVYYGPAVCGKTTSLQAIHQKIAPNQRGKLLSLATETDRTIFFDLLPLKLGEIKGYKLRFQLYTVPGQVKYDNTRKLVLQGADAIVFVADSQKSRRQANIESFRNLQVNLLAQGQNPDEIPVVYEYNKRDVEGILSVQELDQDINPRALPYFETVANQGRGVMETLEAISKLTLESLEERLIGDQRSKTSAAMIASPEKEYPKKSTSPAPQDIMDLTLESPFEESGLSISDEDLAGLELESDLLTPSSKSSPSIQPPSLEDSFALSKPIGYGDDIKIEEAELADLQLIEDEPAIKSRFFDMKEVEAQAFRDLENFLGPLEDSSEIPEPSSSEESFEDSFVSSEESGVALPTEESLMNFKLEPEYEESEQALQESPLLEVGEALSELKPEKTGEYDNLLDLLSAEEQVSEQEADDLLNLDLGEEGMGSRAFLSDFPAGEDFLATSDVEDERAKELVEDFLSSTRSEEESSDVLEEDLFALTGSETVDSENIEALSSEEGTLESVFTSVSSAPVAPGVESPEEKPAERVQSSRGSETKAPEQPIERELKPVPVPEAPSSTLEDPYSGLLKFSKSLCQKAHEFFAMEISPDISLTVFYYYLAVETALKAVALKFDTCNPEIASMPLLLDSIEEETGKSIGGRRLLEERIIKAKNDLQLRLLFPDIETCQMISRTAERFIETLAQDFLNIDFSKLEVVP